MDNHLHLSHNSNLAINYINLIIQEKVELETGMQCKRLGRKHKILDLKANYLDLNMINLGLEKIREQKKRSQVSICLGPSINCNFI